MRFETWVLSAAAGCGLLAVVFSSDEPEAIFWGEWNHGCLPEEVVELTLKYPLCKRDCSPGIYTSYVADYGVALGHVLIYEQRASHPDRVPLLRALMHDLDEFTDVYATFLSCGGPINKQGDYVNNQYLLRQVLEGLDGSPRARLSVMTPQIDYLRWRIEGMKRTFEKYELAEMGPEDIRVELARFEEKRQTILAAWQPLEARLRTLPRPVTMRILKYLEWRFDMGYDCNYLDDFDPKPPTIDEPPPAEQK